MIGAEVNGSAKVRKYRIKSIARHNEAASYLEGITPTRVGRIPRYRPRAPSVAKTDLKESSPCEQEKIRIVSLKTENFGELSTFINLS